MSSDRSFFALVTACFTLSVAASAGAQTHPPPKPETPDVQPPPVAGAPKLGAPPANAISENKVAQLGTFDAGGTLFGHLAFAASYDKPAIATTGGGKLQLSPGWMIGLDGEWNPWISLDTKKVKPGVLNVYASVVRRYQMRYEAVNLRTTLGLGASVLLFDLYGARTGSVGPFVGVSFLGVEWKVAKGWYLVIDPSYLALPVPHVSGAPLGFIQYRMSVGLEVAIF